MPTKKILAMVMAGGNGTRLHPLTAEHSKPALPFADGYRIIDFVLSNLVNSRVTAIYVLAQYKPRSLVEHLQTAWAPWYNDGDRGINVVVRDANDAARSFKGTADAVFQNLHLIDRHQPDLVAVFAADHVYRMDVRQMADFHCAGGAEVSIAAKAVPIDEASEFGIMATGPEGELLDFQEKPERPASLLSDPGRAYASMGNYLFDPMVLNELLEEADKRGDTDFGRHVLPRLARGHRTLAYDFACNKVPGVEPYEEPSYWRDVGTIEAFEAAQRDVRGPLPRFSLANSEWPIHGGNPRRRTIEVRRTNCPESQAFAAAPAASAGIASLRNQPEQINA
jgi:glucose-1-phosphate adenylyltransferase